MNLVQQTYLTRACVMENTTRNTAAQANFILAPKPMLDNGDLTPVQNSTLLARSIFRGV